MTSRPTYQPIGVQQFTFPISSKTLSGVNVLQYDSQYFATLSSCRYDKEGQTRVIFTYLLQALIPSKFHA